MAGKLILLAAVCVVITLIVFVSFRLLSVTNKTFIHEYWGKYGVDKEMLLNGCLYAAQGNFANRENKRCSPQLTLSDCARAHAVIDAASLQVSYQIYQKDRQECLKKYK